MDDIRRKLELIDQQLAGGPNFLERTVNTSPLAIVALGLIAGIGIQNLLFKSRATSYESRFAWLWVALLVFFAASAFTLFTIHRQRPRPQIIAVVAFGFFLCLGAIRLDSFYHSKSNDIRNFVTDEPKLATIRGLIVTEPYIQDNNDWKFARFKFTDPASSFYLKVSEVETLVGWAKATGTVRVQVDGPVLDLKAGDYVQMYCWLDKFKQPTNPGQFNTAKYLSRKNIFVAASVPLRDAIELLLKNSSTGTFVKIKRRLQEIAGQALRGDLDIEGQNYALLQALVLGYRTKIDSDTYRAFQKTGLLHFLCLSGMNFGILIGVIWWLCKTAGLMKPARAVICIFAAVIFLLVVPPNAPALRAGIISFVFCASFFFRRRPNSFNSLSLAAIILLLIEPTQLFEAGWQLSFASVLGILLFCQRILFFLYEKITGHSWFTDLPKTRPFFQIVPRPGPYALQLLSTGIAAWVGSAGILLYQFYTINYLTSIWTVIVSPLIGVISVFGYVKIVLGLFLPSAAAMLDMVIRPLSDLLIWVVKLFAGWNISEILLGKVSPAVVILYYAFLLFAFFVHFRRPFVKKLICAAVALVIIVSLGAAKWHRTYRDDLVLTCLDVGHGQAILAQLPGRANILFDAGSLQKANVGGRVIAPFLDYSGISRIDAIVISHKDIDHINGIPEIVENCKVGAVYADEVFFDEAQKGGATKFLKDYLATKNLEIKHIDTNLSFESPANIKTLWPIKDMPEEQLSDNDKSLVSLIQFAGVKMLLCSDIEKFAQTQLFQTIPDLKADVVVIPHHGSTRTSDADFLEKLAADILIVSCGRTDFERQKKAGRSPASRSFYTAEDGAITVTITKDGTIGTTALARQQR
jgi:competence protein ComEC